MTDHVLPSVAGFTADVKKGGPLFVPDTWSYSRLKDFDECRLKFALKYIVKLEEEPSEAMLRGRKIHKLAEDYIRGDIPPDPFPKPLKKFEELFRWAREDKQFFVEEKWGFTSRWEPTGFFTYKPASKRIWLRSVVDAGRYFHEDNHLVIIDHKTGKLYEVDEGQVELFALAAMARFPGVKTVETRLWYLDSGDEVIRDFSASDFNPMKRQWTERVQPMFDPRSYDNLERCHSRRCKCGELIRLHGGNAHG